MRFWTARSAVDPTDRALPIFWAPSVSTFYTPHDQISLHGPGHYLGTRSAPVASRGDMARRHVHQPRRLDSGPRFRRPVRGVGGFTSGLR